MREVVQTVQSFIREINIQIINRCNLTCDFCPRANISIEELKEIERSGTMEISLFKSVVDKCVSAGVEDFCLTPRMGEVLLDKGLIEKLKYLEQHKGVRKYFFSTNLTLCAKGLILFLNDSEKCTIEISHYGDEDLFYKQTRGKLAHYKMLEKNLSFMLSNVKEKSKVTFFQRFVGENKSILIKLLVSQGAIYNLNETKNYNIGGHLKNDVTEYNVVNRQGQCPTKLSGSILINGDYNLCYMNDIFNTLTQGNILTTSLTELRSNAKLDGHKICELCNECW